MGYEPPGARICGPVRRPDGLPNLLHVGCTVGPAGARVIHGVAMLGMDRAAVHPARVAGSDQVSPGGQARPVWVASPRLLVAQALVEALLSSGFEVELHAWETVVRDVVRRARPQSTVHVLVVFDEPYAADVIDPVIAMTRSGAVRVAVVADRSASWCLPLLDEPDVDLVTTATSLDRLSEVVARFATGQSVVLEEARQALRADWSGLLDNHRHLVSLVQTLTPQQLRVLELLAEGHRVREIALIMAVSDATARSHVRTMRAKLGARSQIEAVAMLRQVHEGDDARRG